MQTLIDRKMKEDGSLKYVMQFMFRSRLEKVEEDKDKPFFCMCPRCWLPHQWKIRDSIGWFIFEFVLYFVTVVFAWDMFRHKEIARIINVEEYPKFKDII